MRRREFITLIGSAAAVPLLRSPLARAQEPGRIYRLAMMTGAPRQAPRMVAFLDELKTLGFVEGQNLKIVAGGFELRNDQHADVAATLLKAAPDVVFCVSDVATRAAHESAPTLPIIGLSDDISPRVLCARSPIPVAILQASVFSGPNSMASAWKSSWRPCPAHGISQCWRTPTIRRWRS